MSDRELIDALIAVRPRLTGGEFSVALARAVGHVTHFDIKRETGLQIDRVRLAEEGLSTKCGTRILRILVLTTNTSTLVRSPQIVETLSTSQKVLGYLLRSVDRTPMPMGKEHKAFAKAYAIAYKSCNRNHAEAISLIKDVIDLHNEDFRKAKYPGMWLPRILETYLSNRPEMPPAIYERMVAKKLRFRYNPKNKQWEEN